MSETPKYEYLSCDREATHRIRFIEGGTPMTAGYYCREHGDDSRAGQHRGRTAQWLTYPRLACRGFDSLARICGTVRNHD